mgnify:CR=1 FL=1
MHKILKLQTFLVIIWFSSKKIETPIWGWGRFGKEVTVKVSWQKNVSFSGKISSSGRWKILIPTPAFGGPYDIFITDGEQNVEFKNVYIGEVWLASGQSNMSMPLKGYICQPVEKSTEAILSASKKQIHFINVPPLAAYKPLDGFDAKWEKASVENAAECSAVGWFFADFLRKKFRCAYRYN